MWTSEARIFRERLRKTKDPCPVCFLHLSRCICNLIPSLRLNTKISLVVHFKELKRSTNTGRLAVSALQNSEMRVRGEGTAAMDLSDLLSPQYRSVLFFPMPDAVELTSQFVAQDARPLHLIVPDGNWRQARKVCSRHPELDAIPRVMISTPNTDRYHLRAESTMHGMATLQAIAHALGIIEGEEVRDVLLKLYQAKLEQTLLARGTLNVR